MIHPISAKTSTEAWLRAVNLLIGMKGRCAYNVILAIEDPITLSPTDKRIVEALDRFLVSHNTMPVTTVAGTIFPAAHYRMRGASGVLEDFPNKIYPKLKKHWGTYAGRMLIRRDRNGQETNPLKTIISKLEQQSHRRGALRAIYEVSLVDIFADIPVYDHGLDARRHFKPALPSPPLFQTAGRSWAHANRALPQPLLCCACIGKPDRAFTAPVLCCQRIGSEAERTRLPLYIRSSRYGRGMDGAQLEAARRRVQPTLVSCHI